MYFFTEKHPKLLTIRPQNPSNLLLFFQPEYDTIKIIR